MNELLYWYCKGGGRAVQGAWGQMGYFSSDERTAIHTSGW
jgi:hypothetical protein